MPAVLLEEIKYESIGSSPDMDGRGPMKVHALQSFERRTEGYKSSKRSWPRPRTRVRDISRVPMT